MSKWCQRNGSSLADACDAWLGLLSEPALFPLEKVVNKRFQDAISLEHLTAYILHSKYIGEKMTMEQQQDLSTWLANHDPGFITSFISFQACSLPRQLLLCRSDQHLLTQLVARCYICGVDPPFADLAQRLTTSPASSASIEKVFSTFSFVHNNIRNRLCSKKQASLLLMHVAWN
ncbi:hypothetical protein LSH36_1591g00009 [Paralvinella palmiformis]|uniref:HAT C-terminal dimerisation domain-containing protein n=1 Tax=Paralvinella palmiformis TaxID=53620 RepID=A0AAD9MML4_9ANNE|nr:hypothetical protein LSH36_1591g00009 [Paralvinella palmiformis]